MDRDYKTLLQILSKVKENPEFFAIEEITQRAFIIEIKIECDVFWLKKDFLQSLINNCMKQNKYSLCSHSTDDFKILISHEEGLKSLEVFSRGGASVFSLNEDGFLSERNFIEILEEFFKNLYNEIMEELK